ncbi:MAG: U32 family peptidase [Bacteroidales bacterium]|nr:U32 family peptidase [Bacteroidales bacterium]
MKKTELLLPVGNTETFYAALEGGADAVFLGLKHFNARGRALNFSNRQIPVLIDLAHKKNCKVYITLNTVIKNNELPELIDVLDYLQNIKPDAVIIQDWGIYHIIKKYFPGLTVHASTQMANHNSIGANYSYEKQFERVILARELTLQEAADVNKKTKIETEVFIHGALCYSFSGMCNFSSYLGGHGANRGICSQVCRRTFDTGKDAKYFYSLKDNQQIENIHNLIDVGIDSLKIEGRMKSSDYVYKVARAYRKVMDDKKNLPLAQEMLKTETGRKKTGYFLANDLSDAITYKSPNTGLFMGTINKLTKQGFEFETDFDLNNDFRIRIKHPVRDEQQNLKVKEFTQTGKNVNVVAEGKFVEKSTVYLSGIIEKKFSSKLPEGKGNVKFGVSYGKKKNIAKSFAATPKKKSFTLFVRIDSLAWMRKIRFDAIDNIIFSFTQKELDTLDPSANLIQKFKQKIWIEFPHFIPEGKIEYYKNIAKKYSEKGLSKFFLSHISQKLLLPKNAIFAGNENMYVYNDAASDFYYEEGAKLISYPVENDEENIFSYQNKKGIMPIYFYPRLFISRMPIKIREEESFKDDTGNIYNKYVIDGITYTVPEIPVSFMQYVSKLKQHGFKNFLIDLSFEKPSSNRINTLIKRYKASQQIQPSVNFNYKRSLK